MDSFGKYLISYASDLQRAFKLKGFGLRFLGVSWAGKEPTQPPLKHPSNCWGINYNPNRTIGTGTYPWAVWVFLRNKEGKVLRDVVYLDYADNPEKEARLYLERVSILAGKPFSSEEELLEFTEDFGEDTLFPCPE